ncbi:hypothetical protein CEXT_352491 [Caerostris extrusa]|uniref:Uncharacterized protein n=1 Tax=Caerostris extrusa TaxID=172846 RepID=A0AAV4N8E9_CAEEX|nr:hypothetical protein CEXT_352491 [Caerostris extrusa]
MHFLKQITLSSDNSWKPPTHDYHCRLKQKTFLEAFPPPSGIRRLACGVVRTPVSRSGLLRIQRTIPRLVQAVNRPAFRASRGIYQNICSPTVRPSAFGREPLGMGELDRRCCIW